MGQQLVGMLAQASSISMQAKMKLIMLTSITSAKAATEPDSPELVKKMTEALKAVKAELG